MRKAVFFILFCGLTLPIGGCGTVANLMSDDPGAFGSLAHDPLLESALNSDPASAPKVSPPTLSGKNGAMALAAIIVLAPTIFATDICLDVAGDALTLPVAVYLHNKAHAYDGIALVPPPSSQPPAPLQLPTCLLEQQDDSKVDVFPPCVTCEYSELFPFDFQNRSDSSLMDDLPLTFVRPSSIGKTQIFDVRLGDFTSLPPPCPDANWLSTGDVASPCMKCFGLQVDLIKHVPPTLASPSQPFPLAAHEVLDQPESSHCSWLLESRHP
jgi:hypothetical protein